MATVQSPRKPKTEKSSRPQIRGAAGLQDLLTELASVLLPRGMTPKRFSELARSAFVQAAADLSRLRNGRVNHSRVAAQTGLTRADVKRLLWQNVFDTDTAGRDKTPVESVIEGWRADRAFVTRPGHPRRLRISGSNASFARLVRKYGGDVPHRAVLDELRRIGAVSDANGSVLLRASPHLSQRHNYAFLSPVLPALIDGLRIASKKPGPNVSSSIYRLSLAAETEVDLAIVRDRCTSSAQSMLDGLANSLGSQVTVPRRRRSPSYSLAVTILLAERRRKKAQRSR
jgi:hypothetical protein